MKISSLEFLEKMANGKRQSLFFPKNSKELLFHAFRDPPLFYAILSFHNSRPWLEVTVSTLDTLLLITPSHLLAPGRELRIVSIHRVDVSSLSAKVSCFRFQTTLTMHDGPRNGTQESVFAPRKDTKVWHKTHTIQIIWRYIALYNVKVPRIEWAFLLR